jgi:hypothetical protein
MPTTCNLLKRHSSLMRGLEVGLYYTLFTKPQLYPTSVLLLLGGFIVLLCSTFFTVPVFWFSHTWDYRNCHKSTLYHHSYSFFLFLYATHHNYHKDFLIQSFVCVSAMAVFSMVVFSTVLHSKRPSKHCSTVLTLTLHSIACFKFTGSLRRTCSMGTCVPSSRRVTI